MTNVVECCSEHHERYVTLATMAQSSYAKCLNVILLHIAFYIFMQHNMHSATKQRMKSKFHLPVITNSSTRDPEIWNRRVTWLNYEHLEHYNHAIQTGFVVIFKKACPVFAR